MLNKLDNDKMNSANPVLVGQVAMSVIDAVQDYSKEVQVLGMAASFLALAERFNIHPGNAFLTVQSVMNGVAGTRGEFAAVKSYLKEEI